MSKKKAREEVGLRDAPAFNDSFGIPDETSHEKKRTKYYLKILKEIKNH